MIGEEGEGREEEGEEEEQWGPGWLEKQEPTP